MGGFCGGGSSSRTSSRSAGRGSGRGKSARQTVKSAASSLATDIKMGLSTFGQSKERQAQTLRDQGYSERAIQSYQERSAASLARAQAEQARISKDDKSAAVTSTPETTGTTDTDTADTTTTETTTKIDVPSNVSDIGTDTVVDTGVDTTYRGGNVDVGDVIDNRVVTSETEAEAIESTGKGRRSTIATSPKGLLGTGGATRPRRSLVGGGLIR